MKLTRDRLLEASPDALSRLLEFMGEKPPRRRRDEYITFYRRRLALIVHKALSDSQVPSTKEKTRNPIRGRAFQVAEMFEISWRG